MSTAGLEYSMKAQWIRARQCIHFFYLQFQVSIRYGATLQSERSRILRHAAKVTTRRAWQRQKELLLTKRFQEAQSWTAYEKNQLSRQGNNPSLALPNYQVEFVRNLDEFPELAADLSNVIFFNQTKRKVISYNEEFSRSSFLDCVWKN